MAPWPGGFEALRDDEVEREFALVRDVIGKVRNIRSEVNLDVRASVRLRVAVEDEALASMLRRNEGYVKRLARVEALELAPLLTRDGPAAAAVAGGLALEVPLAGLIDLGAYESRLHREIERARDEIASLERKMGNARFVERAPAEVVEENRQRLADYRATEAKLVAGLERLR
jgi:valyl-tRNA synthetase